MAFELTKPFIEKLLKTSIKDFKVSAGCNEGDNLAGTLKAIRATTKSEEVKNAVYKTFPSNAEFKAELIQSGAFHVEVNSYTLLFPTLQKLVKSRGVDYSPPVVELYDYFNDDINDYICLQDVRPQGYKMTDKFIGLTYPETSLAMKTLAQFHAFTYFLIKEMGEQIFTSNSEQGGFTYFDPKKLLEAEMTSGFLTMLNNAVDSAVTILDKTKPQLANRLRLAVPEGKGGDIFDEIRTSTDKENFPVIVHGDFWSNNFLIKYDQDKGKPSGIIFVDFQFTRRGNIFEDLIYFIFTSTTTQFRSLYLSQVLFDYYESFQSSLKSVNCPMPIKFSRGSLIDSFHKYSLAGLAHMTFAIPLQLGKVLVPQQNGQDGDESKDKLNLTKLPEDNYQDAFAKEVEMMLEGSPRAIQRLEEITEEILNQIN